MGSGGQEQPVLGEQAPLLRSNGTNGKDSDEIGTRGASPKTTSNRFFQLAIVIGALLLLVPCFVVVNLCHQQKAHNDTPPLLAHSIVHDVLSRQLEPLFSSSASRILYCCQTNNDDDDDFVVAATVWRQDVSSSKSQPVAVIEAHSAEDVAHAIPILAQLQQTAQAPFRIRSGGHNKAGFSTVAGGIILSLKHMNQVELLSPSSTEENEQQQPATTTSSSLPRTVTAWIQPGATVEDLLDQLLATQGYSGAIGQCGRVAEGGWALGGGMGFMSRLLGLGLDNVRAMQVVLANGTTVLTNASSNNTHTDLFWALRGAGSGSFGVVTGMEYQLHATPMTQLFKAVLIPLEDMGRVWYEMAQRDMEGTLSPYFNVVFGGKENRTLIKAYMSWFALDDETLAQGNNYYQDEILPMLQSTITRETHDHDKDDGLSAIIRSSQHQPWQPFQWPHDTHELFDNGYGKSVWAAQVWQGFLMPVNNTPAVWQNIMDIATPLLLENPDLEPHVELWGGRITDVDSNATAFPYRQAIYNFGFQLYVNDPEDDASFHEQAARVSAAWPRLAYHLTGAYVNYPMNSLSNDEYPRLYWGSNLDRLVDIKRRYDPMNLFSFEQSVPPKPTY